jgi:hypothetical protein
MAKTNRVVKDLDHAIKIYGGPREFAQSFKYPSTEFIVRWHQFGVSAGARLGLFMGLVERGYIPHPTLYGVGRGAKFSASKRIIDKRLRGCWPSRTCRRDHLHQTLHPDSSPQHSDR